MMEYTSPRGAPSLTLRIEKLSMSGVALTVLVFGTLVAATVVIGIYGPQMHIGDADSELQMYQLPANPGDKWTFEATLRNMDQWNRRFVVSAYPFNKKSDVAGFSKLGTFYIDLSGRSSSSEPWTPIVKGSKKQRTINCMQGKPRCELIPIMQESFLHYREYLVTVTVDNFASEVDFLSSLGFQFLFTNKQYTLFELVARYSFLLVTLVCVGVGLQSMRPYAARDWIPEQRWVGMLALACIAFNNPIFICDLLVDSWVFPFITNLFQVSFVACLMLVWLLVADSIMEDEAKRTFLSFYLPKLLLVSTIWVILISLFTLDMFHQISDPAYLAYTDFSAFPYVVGALTVLMLIYLCWIAYLSFRIVGELRNIPQTPTGFKFLCVLSLAVFIATALGIYLNGIGPLIDSPAKFLSFLAVLNFYVYTLIFVFMPVPAGRSGAGAYSARLDQKTALFSGPSSSSERV
eukprot:tig00000789_g4102.t1